ncbi:protein prenylyltransferase [Rhizopus microsporus ATCC 52813]|uniref:Protein prenylyltransferase n=2 Tax=Rhizopus microsporus TaxID=58291 RepID=A0A2G4T2K0_RHIZD|nr:protein prenylyltransferase [Rhizopus microsporus ATCC 52813]PHZ15243.1 protein prenylyltransferase [Rhizopus microsporus ATCC 52813]
MIKQLDEDYIHALDDPNNVKLSKRLTPSQAQLVLVRLLDVIQRQIKSGELETPDDWQAQFSKIILARIYFETGRYDKALEWLQQLALRLEDVESGYGLVQLVQARVIKGRCFEHLEKDVDALESYMLALSVVEEHPDEKNKALASWVEDCLYRSILLQLRRKGPVKQTLKLMRAYTNYCHTQWWPVHFRIHKRWIIFRHYIRYLTRAYQKGLYIPAGEDDSLTSPVTSPVKSTFSENSSTSASALDETILLVNEFRALLNEFVKRSLSTEPIDINHKTLEICHLIVSAHDTVGWGPEEHIERMLRFFYKARALTFNSPSISRHIFYLHLYLNQHDKATLALKSYLELLGLPDILKKGDNLYHDEENEDHSLAEGMISTIQQQLQKVQTDSNDSASQCLQAVEQKINSVLATYDEKSSDEDEFLPPAQSSLLDTVMTKRKVPPGACENDNEFDVVRVLLAGAQQIYSCLPQNNEGIVLCDLAMALLEEAETLKKKKMNQWKLLMIQCRRARGCSYGLYASKHSEPERRLECFNEALVSLKRASELDSRSWQTFYELGLQQAIAGNMSQAISAVKRSIKLRGDFIPSWHLLALIQSSREFQDLPKALAIAHTAVTYNADIVNEDDEDTSSEFFERAIAFMKLKMSQMYILEAIEGHIPEGYMDLLNLFYKISKKLNLIVTPVSSNSKRPSVYGHSNSSSMVMNSRQRAGSYRISNHSSIYSNNSSSMSLYAMESVDSLHMLQNDNEEEKEDSKLALLKVEEVQEEEQEGEAEMQQQASEESVSRSTSGTPMSDKKRSRRSFSLSRPQLEDPLLSLPSIRKKKEKSNTTQKPRKSIISGLRAYRNSISGSKEVASSENSYASVHKNESNAKQAEINIVTNQSTSVIQQPVEEEQSEKKIINIHPIDYQNRWKQILVNIWIMTSQSYLKDKQYEDAVKAIEEADQLTNGESAQVWHQIGLIILAAEKGNYHKAIDAFKMALTIDSDHVLSIISLASVYLDINQYELAEQLLEKTTKGLGWNQPEAWYLLSKVYMKQESMLDAKHCLLYALQLSETVTIQPLDGFPRFV